MTGATLAPGIVEDVPAAPVVAPAPNKDAADGVEDNELDEPKLNRFVLELLVAALADPVAEGAAILPKVGKLPNVVFEFLVQILLEAAAAAATFVGEPSAPLPLAINGVTVAVLGNFVDPPNVFVLAVVPPTPKLNLEALAAGVAN